MKIKQKNFFIASVCLLVFIILFGFNYRIIIQNPITWSKKTLNWENFTRTHQIGQSGQYDADIYSEIKYIFNEKEFKIYAYMDPKFSHKLKGTKDQQLLIHEAYHFNITEYFARLFRKKIIDVGKNNITKSKVDSLYNSIESLRDKMQAKYDNESDHNKIGEKQRYWELKIDDLLRETEIYRNLNLNLYASFNLEKTTFFKEVKLLKDNKIITSYPIDKSNKDLGSVYEVVSKKDTVIIKHFKNGKLTNAGNFQTAIFKLFHSPKNITELHFLNPKNKYNNNLNYHILKKSSDVNNVITLSYLDKDRNRLLNNGVYFQKWKPIKKNKFLVSFHNKKGQKIYNNSNIFYDRITLDTVGRVSLIEHLNKNKFLTLDKEKLIAYTSYSYNSNHKISHKTEYNYYGKLAVHKNQYNLLYKYDYRGNISSETSVDISNKKIEDQNGVSIYKYSYDLNDNLIQTKRYNRDHLPVLGNSDYFKSVKDYDSNNRLIFKAEYYFQNTLKFDADDRWGATKYTFLGDSIIFRNNVDAYNDTFNDDTGIAIVKAFIDINGNTTKVQYLDQNKHFAKTSNKVTEYQFEYDSNGNSIKETSLDSIGNLTPFSEDVSTIKWDYNKNNIKIKTTYFNKDGLLANGNQNATYNLFSHNDKNEIIETQNLTKEKIPVEIDGIFKGTYIVNRFGKDSIIKYYNKNNKLINGIAIYKYKYNNYGTLIEESYYNSRGKITIDSNLVSYKRILTNSSQQTIGYKFFGKKFNRINNKTGYHHEKISLNQYGYIVSYEYFDKKRKRALNSDGFHKILYERDSLGENIRSATFDIKMKLKEDADGVAEYKYVRAKTGLTKILSTFNKKGSLKSNDKGVAQTFYTPYLNGLYYIEKELDSIGNVVKKEKELDKTID